MPAQPVPTVHQHVDAVPAVRLSRRERRGGGVQQASRGVPARVSPRRYAMRRR